MNLADILILVGIAFCLAIAGVFLGYQKSENGGCSGSCSSCSMDCSNVPKKEEKKEK